MKGKTIILIASVLLSVLTACNQSDAGSTGAEGEETAASIDEDQMLENSVAKGVMAALEKEEPYGTEVPFGYITFDPGATVVPEDGGDSFRELSELASVMNANPNLNISIQAYVDDSNSRESDPDYIARMRTFFIKSQLIDRGVSAQLIETEGIVVDTPAENGVTVKVLGE